MTTIDNADLLDRMLGNAHSPISLERICEVLECSEPTAKRVIAYLRNIRNAPIKYSRDPPGYRYTDAA